MSQLKHAVLSGVRWTLAARVGLQLVTWPITIIVMRLLEPGDYGLFAIALLIQGFVTLFAELGFGVALVQAPQVSEAQARMVMTLVTALNAAVMLCLLVAAPWIARQYGEPELTWVIWVLTGELFFAAIGAVPLAMLERTLRFRAISLAQLAGGVSAALVTLAGALMDCGVWALVAGALTNALVRTSGWLLAYGRIVLPGRVELHAIRPMTQIGGHAMAARILWYCSGQADNLILGLLLQARALGAYNVASQLAMLPAGKAMEAVNRVAFPVLCRARDQLADLRASVRRLRALLALYGFGICWGLAGVAPEFIQVVLGEKWAIAQWPLAVLALVAPLRMLGAFNNTIVTAVGKPQAATYELLLASVLVPGAVGVGAWLDGLRGASLAWLVAYPVVFAVSGALTARALQERWRETIRPVAMPMLAGAAMLVAIWACRHSLAGLATPVVVLAAQLVAAALVYLAVLWLSARALLLDTRDLVHALFIPKRAA